MTSTVLCEKHYGLTGRKRIRIIVVENEFLFQFRFFSFFLLLFMCEQSFQNLTIIVGMSTSPTFPIKSYKSLYLKMVP